ncbi:copper resistance protein CopC [Sporolactobacillus sp. STSJ-5]|uniref:copper resistance CopC/CopD family protein n=1 Tax=Sporolactobacillus sp. STSJ-5 TaxID=2965076 RepID=UPI00210410EC|nr:copper resistance protein CopC [Sporolactobacillus sp. STSJ-5]MCQ2011358.1 copper resistance protein CopC [Sporolactobacillus sp. STSJ-5]
MMKQNICAFIAIILFSLLFAQFSSAHAYVIKSNPGQNQQASADFKTVSIQFSEEIQQTFLTLQILDKDGHRVDTNQAHIDKKNPAVLVNNVKKKLAVGYYTIKWKVISADGHAVNGTIGFKVGQPANRSTVPQTDKTGNDLPGADNLVIRWLIYGGLSFYFGFVVFLKFLYPARSPLIYKRKSTRIALWISGGILLLGVFLALPLQVTSNAGVNWLHAFNGEALRTTLVATSFGPIWFLMLGTLLASFVLQYGVSRTRSEQTADYLIWAQIILLFLFSLSKAFLGHAGGVQNQETRLLAVFADFLHLSAAAIWLGSLFSLLFFLPRAVKKDYLPEQQKTAYWQTVHRFSPFAIILVGGIFLTGLIGSLIHLPTFSALYTSAYGWIILIKAVLLVIMLLFALYSYLRGQKQGEFLKKSVLGELLIGLVVLFAAAVLANVSPPVPKQAKADSTFEGFSAKFNHGKSTKNENPPTQLTDPNKTTRVKEKNYELTLRVEPLKLGPNTLYLDVLENGKRARNLQQAVIKIRCIDMDMGETKIQVPLSKLGKGIVVKDALDMKHRFLINVHVLDKNYQVIERNFIASIK